MGIYHQWEYHPHWDSWDVMGILFVIYIYIEQPSNHQIVDRKVGHLEIEINIEVPSIFLDMLELIPSLGYSENVS